MKIRSQTKYIIVHCSDSTFGTKDLIDSWHRQRGFPCGYQFVILNGTCNKNDVYIEPLDGAIEVGRHVDEQGAHCKDINDRSIGICMIGDKKFSKKQIRSLFNLCRDLLPKYGLNTIDIKGHYEFNAYKTCPNLNMQNIRKEYDNFCKEKVVLDKNVFKHNITIRKVA